MTATTNPFDTGLMTSLVGDQIRDALLVPEKLESVVTVFRMGALFRAMLTKLGVPDAVLDRAGEADESASLADEMRAIILSAGPPSGRAE